MIEAYVRPLYQFCLVNPIAKRVNRISAKNITFFSCATGVLAAIVLILNLQLLAIILLLLSGFLDTLDGTVARLQNQVSTVGTVLDIISDRTVECAVILGLFLVDPSNRGLATLAMLASCYLCVTSFLVVGIFIPNNSQKGFHYSPGLIERAEAFIFFILMIWVPDYFTLLAGLFTTLVTLTCYLRIKQFIKFSSCKW